MKNKFSAVICVGVFVWSFQAQADCKKPDYDPPNCTNQYIEIQFSDSKDFERCKKEVTYFLENLDIWTKCVKDEARLKGDEAIKLFNCKVNGTTNCLNTSG
ncbi:hypothetical protein [Kiloniella sp.]|uniref:hypothetical protein n=1 Tax=Kiloniella sp. TaxID=1938587 RepID=UPI003B023680